MNDIFVKTESSLTRGIPRTQKKVPFTHKTSFNSAEAVPLLSRLVYPGTTIQMDLHTITRMATPVNPIMDDIYQDFHFFFVPLRVIYDLAVKQGIATGSWDEFIAYSDWDSVSTLKLPSVIINPGCNAAIKPGTIGHYMGLPIGCYTNEFSKTLSMMQLVGYVDIWNKYFRDENYQTEIVPMETIRGHYVADDTGAVIYPSDAVGEQYRSYFDKCLFVNEFHDPFTSVLPSPQKGPESTISLGELAPVVTGDIHEASTGVNLRWRSINEGVYNPVNNNLLGIFGGGRTGAFTSTDDNVLAKDYLVPANLYADLSKATSITINQLRESIVLQHYLETLARSGSRYNEWLLGFFDVVSPDARLQRPEYIVGKRVHINISEVLQTSGEAVNDTVLGTTGAVSRTMNSNKNLFTYSAVEHGLLYCITTVRHSLSYSQGISKEFTNLEALDFYNPVFNGIGEQPIYKREILANIPNRQGLKRPEFDTAGTSVVNFGDNASILGYNEPWWDIFYMPSRSSGLLDPVGATSLNTWTLTKTFDTPDITGAQVRVADDTTIDRTIRVQNEDQFIGEYLFDMTITAKKPLRSLPGIMRV